jgi:hypothetical protein
MQGLLSDMTLLNASEEEKTPAGTVAAPAPQSVKGGEPRTFDFAAAPRRMSAELAAELLIATMGAGAAVKAARQEVQKARRARSKARHQFWSSVVTLAGEASKVGDTDGNSA